MLERENGSPVERIFLFSRVYKQYLDRSIRVKRERKRQSQLPHQKQVKEFLRREVSMKREEKIPSERQQRRVAHHVHQHVNGFVSRWEIPCACVSSCVRAWVRLHICEINLSAWRPPQTDPDGHPGGNPTPPSLFPPPTPSPSPSPPLHTPTCTHTAAAQRPPVQHLPSSRLPIPSCTQELRLFPPPLHSPPSRGLHRDAGDICMFGEARP